MAKRKRMREAALAAKYIGRKTHPGWFDAFRDKDPEAYRELYELIRDYEKGDPELRAKFPSRRSFWRSYVQNKLQEARCEVGVGAFEAYCRLVSEGASNVQP